jgi:hypothetical protein
MKLALLSPALLLIACGGAAPAAHTGGVETSSSVSSDKPAAAPARDPKIMQLATAAAACKFEDGQFDDDCEAYKAWKDEDDLFADGKGDDTLFSMLGDPDLKVRLLATDKSISDLKAYFADRGKAARLVALLEKEQNETVLRDLVRDITRVDLDAVNLSGELMKLAKSPVIEVRKGLSGVIAHYQTPAAIGAMNVLLQDPEKEVQRSAISSLSSGGITPGTPEVCGLMTEQIKRTDDLAGDALWWASSSKCNIDNLVVAELTKRIADPSKVTNANGIGYSLAIGDVCRHAQTPEAKKAGFALAKALVSPAVKDSNTRRAALGALPDCDKAGALAVAKTLTADKDIGKDAKKLTEKH